MYNHNMQDEHHHAIQFWFTESSRIFLFTRHFAWNAEMAKLLSLSN